MWTGKSPNMSFMRIWGCKAYVEHQMSSKLEPKSQKCTFVGHPKETKGYYFYNENKVFVARTRVFLEKEFLTNQGKGRNIELKEVQQQVIEPEVEEVSQAVEENSTDLETQPLRRSTRERHEPERYGFLVTTHGDFILVDQDEPKTYQEAVSSSDSEKWLEAMRSEMDSMSDNQVWTLVEPPEGVKPIGCKWVFKKKNDIDGNVQTYKGQLVAKGFRQIHGVDYDETFSLVAMFKSIRILLVVAAFHDYEIWQMDVKTAFLNGKLEEDVYMTQPEGNVSFNATRKRTNESNPICFGYWINHANPGEGHWTAVKNILKYLRRTKDVFLVYGGKEELGIKGYTDASFQTDKNDSRLQSGFVFCLNKDIVSKKSSKQDTVADSTTKAEYVSASEATKETIWIKEFLFELRVIISIADAAIAQAKEPRSHQRPKHTFKCFYLI
ncbi:hypothetical protein V6N13_016124 [Hibiscus sabdariffa]|uniref:Reverse transcriptase Ty1/copia-type domain-containing protein n=1 Tax=Hibiscus sabdariffa TaxID=183260 RepID=A0ABR2NFM9_9ROSI